MLGAVSPESFDTLHSYSNTFQMPFVTPWFPEKVCQQTQEKKLLIYYSIFCVNESSTAVFVCFFSVFFLISVALN